MPVRYDHDMQLGQFDVPAEVLNAAGHRLEHIIGASASTLVDDLLGRPPVDGWRLISGDLEAPAVHQPVLAAPWDHPRGNGWMVIALWQLDGAWQATILGDTHPIRPSRAMRREGLELSWPHSPDLDLTFQRADTRLEQVPVVLRNVSAHIWVNRHEDDDGVSIFVSDKGGHPVTNNHRGNDWGMVAYSVGLLPSIEPGAEMTLMAHFDAATAYYGLPPRSFTLVACMHSIGLRSQPRSLVVEPRTGATR